MNSISKLTFQTVRRLAHARFIVLVSLASAFLVPDLAAGADQAASATGASSIAIELNKLEPQGNQCRAYFVISNKSSTNYQVLKLDLVSFRPDGVIGRRFAVDLGPIKPSRRTVKLYELADTACDDVGSVLINEVMECRADSGPVTDCLNNISVSSLAKAQLTK